MDISDDSSHCNNLPEFPSKVQFATGGRLNGHPLICGGQSTINSTDITDECYIYNEEWTLLTNMIHKRYGAGGTAIDEDTFWIIGGSGQTQSSEYVFSNGSVIEGPDFDVGFEWHCMVRLDNGRIMIINHSKGTYCISSYSFRGNYSFLNLTLCTVTFGNSTYMCGNYSRKETIQGPKLYEEIRYVYMGAAFNLG